MDGPPVGEAAARDRTESLWQLAGSLLRDLPGLIGDRVELAALELRRAGETLAQIVALVVAAAILGVTAWLALWLVIVSLFTQAGLHPLLALALGIALNLAIAAWAIQRARGLTRRVGLPATYRHLTSLPADTAAPPRPSRPPVHATPTEPAR